MLEEYLAMDTRNKKLILRTIIYYLIGFLPLILTFFVYPDIPDQVPSHYSTAGEVAKWDSKQKVLIIPFLLAAFTYFKPRIFTQKFQTESEEKISNIATLLFMIAVNLLSYVELYTSLKGPDILTRFNFYNLLSLIICFVFIFLGYIFSSCSRNDTFSIKVPIHLMEDSIWKNIHHNLGSYWMSSSIVCLPISILCGSNYIVYLLLAEFIFIILIPILVALIYIKKHKKVKNN